jgi:dihydroflavonol-4-reductase
MKTYIFITGASGFLGSNIAANACEKKFNIKCLENKTKLPNYLKKFNPKIIKGDIRKPKNFQSQITDCSTIIHAAASFDDSDDLDEINYYSTLELFRVAKENNIKQFIYISSRTTFGINKDVCQSNENSDDFSNHINLDKYSNSKIKAENALIFASKNSSINLLILCPTAIIGPNDFKPSQIGKIINYLTISRLRFYIDGMINIIDVRDVAEVCISNINNPKKFGRYGLGGKNISISELIFLIDSILRKINMSFKLNYKFILFFSIILSKFNINYFFKELITPIRLKRLKNGISCFNSKKAKNEIGLKIRNIEVTINDIIKSK